ncbi:MAG: hypothetical protein M9962_15675 [Oligoflexia bacterium]|nr:hypothetical protein [Oligoflexia bacterium]
MFEISSEEGSYNSGERAKISVRELVSLEDKEMEYALVAKVDDSNQRIDRVKEGLFKSETSPLSSGTHIFSIEVFKQNKRFARDIEKSLDGINREILSISKELEKETDMEKRNKLLKRKEILQKREIHLQERLNSHRQSLGLRYNYNILIN